MIFSVRQRREKGSKIKHLVPAPLLVGVELNPGPGGNGYLDEETRWEAVFLIKHNKLSQRKVAEKLGTSRTSICKLWKKYRQTGSVHDQPGKGRKRKLSSGDETLLVRQAKKHKAAPELCRTMEKLGKNVGQDTVRKALKKHGLRYLQVRQSHPLTSSQKAKRFEYAKEMKHYDWSKVIFSDEKTFWLGSGTTYAWQCPNRRETRQVGRYPPKLHVWAAIGSYGKIKPYFFRENMNAPLYQQILRERIKESRVIYAPDEDGIQGKWVFLQDNDPKHKAKKSIQELENLIGSRYIHHPAYSPDLNPMEDIWSYLNRKVLAAKITCISGLQRVLTREWNSMPWTEIRRSVDSMPDRLKQCRDRKGDHTDY